MRRIFDALAEEVNALKHLPAKTTPELAQQLALLIQSKG